MEPQGVATIYNSNYVEVQDVILIDSFSDPETGGSSWWYGGLTFATNGPSNTNNNIRGLIQLNVEGSFTIAGGGGDINNIQIDDVAVAWTDARIYKKSGELINLDDGATKSLSVNRATVYGSRGVGYLNYGGTYSLNIKNSIFSNISNAIFFNGEQTLTENFNNCYNPPIPQYHTACASNATNFNPLANGLSYLTRVESDSTLSSSGEAGGQQGASIVKRVGVSGTMYGEDGYDQITDDDLWPWPYQDRIKQEMCTDAKVIRGFCEAGVGKYGGSVTLTSYIWEALGNTCPSNICPR